MSDTIDTEKEEKQKQAAELRKAFLQDKDDFIKNYNKNWTMEEYFGIPRPDEDKAHDATQAGILWGIMTMGLGAPNDMAEAASYAKNAGRNIKDAQAVTRMISKAGVAGKDPAATYGPGIYHALKGMQTLAKKESALAARSGSKAVGKTTAATLSAVPLTRKILSKVNKQFDYGQTDWDTVDEFFDFVDSNKDYLPKERIIDFMNAYADYVSTDSKKEKIKLTKYLGELIKGTRLAENYLGRNYDVYGDSSEE